MITKRMFIFSIIMIILSVSNISGATYTVGHGGEFNFQTITDALASANAQDTILVSAGTYKSNHPQYPETFPLIMKEGVVLKRMSDDILPVIDAQYSARVFNCFNIASGSGTKIEGFEITNGWVFSSNDDDYGGGLYIKNATLTIQSCTITGNMVEKRGGGVCCSASNPTLIDCIITSNEASDGGGIHAGSNSEPVIINCLISSNSASNSGGGIVCSYSPVKIYATDICSNTAENEGAGIFSHGSDFNMEKSIVSGNSTESYGGGIVCKGYRDPTITDCTIIDNSAATKGGGLYCQDATVLLTNCMFKSNSALNEGGGLYFTFTSSTLINCKISDCSAVTGAGVYFRYSDTQLTNCILNDNTAGEFGGGFGCYESSPVLNNCTITSNTAWDGGGAFSCSSSSYPILKNCILWNDIIDEIFIFSGIPNVTYCDVQGGWTGDGNINVDPVFIPGPGEDYYLSQVAAGQSTDSPCVDSGSDLALNISFPYKGSTWYMDQVTTRTDGVADSGQVDMGAHYFPAQCTELGCRIDMPSNNYGPGDECYCDVVICNPGPVTYKGIPVFVVLDVYGVYFFAPGYSDFDYYTKNIYPGETTIQILPSFSWPSGVGSASGIMWYAGMTNHAMTELYGNVGVFSFGWHE